MKKLKHLLPAISLLLLPALAQAHPGHGTGASLLAGAVHPLLGLDHLLALLAAGLLAWRMAGRARIGIAIAFPALMALGAIAGLIRVPLSITEVMILLSIAVLAMLALKPPRKFPVVTTLVAALFAVFHGHAHGVEAAEGVAGPAFVAGMALASALVICAAMMGAQLFSQRLAASASR
jgi:urease accessory protein